MKTDKELEEAKECAYHSCIADLCCYHPWTSTCTYPECDKEDLWNHCPAYKKKEHPVQKCVSCGRDIDIVEENVYGNFCRANESYCKECYEKLDNKTKKMLDWHFSCDWL